MITPSNISALWGGGINYCTFAVSHSSVLVLKAIIKYTILSVHFLFLKFIYPAALVNLVEIQYSYEFHLLHFNSMISV